MQLLARRLAADLDRFSSGGGAHGVPGANAVRAALTRDRTFLGPYYRAAIAIAQRAACQEGPL
jgi:hypothetical protein